MPGIKFRTTTRRKRQPPRRGGRKTSDVSVPPVSSGDSAIPPVPAATTSTSDGASAPSSSTLTASEKKLSKSVHTTSAVNSDSESSESDFEMFDTHDEQGMRLLEVAGLQEALKESVCCKKCGEGSVIFKEDFSRKQGLSTSPFLFCEHCSHRVPIPFSSLSASKVLAVNLKASFANKCVGGNFSSLQMFCSILDLPQPVTKNVHTQYMKMIREQSNLQAQESMKQAQDEVREFYDASSADMLDILVSCDGTWQRRGFSSLFGAVFVIAHETGKVIDYVVKSKDCAGCKYWNRQDQSSEAYQRWTETHECEINFSGSAGAMEPEGTLEMVRRSSENKLRYKYLISDGDSKTHSLLLNDQPYGSDCLVEKLDCVGHVQKRMGTALRNLKQQYRGQKLSDGKTIGGAGRLTDSIINSLQNYYGDAIRRNKGDLAGMVKAVQATLLHSNSTDETPRHHLCPEGKESWCKWQSAKAQGLLYKHKNPIPEAIVALIRPIYTRLGSRSLLEKCVEGYTQNANESLHSTVWKFCPKEVYLGRVGVDIACALAVCCFNDGSSSLAAVSSRLGLEPSPLSKQFLKRKDIKRIKKSKYKSSECAMKLRRLARRKRKGLDDKTKSKEGVVYAAGAFGGDGPGPSKRAKTT